MVKKVFCQVVFLFVLTSMVFGGFMQEAKAKTKHPLVGVWTLQYEGELYPVVCYKILKKNGRYANIKSTDWDAKYFAASHYGKFKAGGGWYVERLKYEKGKKFRRMIDVPLTYEFLDKNTVQISYPQGGKKYTEVWHRVPKAPKYEK